MTASIYDAIGIGDEVGVVDEKKNLILGPMRLTADGTMCVHAFGCLIAIARRNRNKTWVAVPGIKLVQHQAHLEWA